MREVARRQATASVLIASGLAHVAVLGLLALVRPELTEVAPPPAVFDVQILPRMLPSPIPDETVAVRDLQVRRPRQAPSNQAVRPLVVPERAIAPPGAATPPGPAVPAAPSNIRNALRRGAVGCANPALLSPEEQDACLERLGAGAEETPFIEAPMSRDKRRSFDEKVAASERMRVYRETGVYPGLREALKAAK